MCSKANYGVEYIMECPVQDDVKTAENDDNVDGLELNAMRLYSGGWRKEMGHNMALGGVMWSIGWNGWGQQGNGSTKNVNKLTVHQWAKDIDIIKVVSNGMDSFILHFQFGDVFSCFEIAMNSLFYR